MNHRIFNIGVLSLFELFGTDQKLKYSIMLYYDIMVKESAGVLVHRCRRDGFEFLLVHPGGPFYENRDSGTWSIPKGEMEPGETPIDVAMREFKEETGFDIWKLILEKKLEISDLGTIRQRSGKIVHAYSVEADLDTSVMKSNTFSMEWPPQSGITRKFPEVDKWMYCSPSVARIKINSAQLKFISNVSAGI